MCPKCLSVNPEMQHFCGECTTKLYISVSILFKALIKKVGFKE